jgi:hypothetical protein
VEHNYVELSEQGAQIWKLLDQLFIGHACLLALGFDPHDAPGVSMMRKPVGYSGLYEAIVQDIGKVEKGDSSPVLSISDFHFTQSGTFYTYIIKQSAFKAWLEERRFKSEYFDTSNAVQKPIINTNHKTSLMMVMEETINRYYGDQYDPSNKDSLSSQKDVVEWLMSHKNLSKREAEAIDIVTRPDNARKPKGKN